ncbi:833_t:CDS:2, partial [Racocetra persica]
HSKNILIDDRKALITDFGISSRFNNTTALISGAGNNMVATLSTLISSSPENKRVRIKASDEQSWFQHDKINMQQLYEINMQNTQNATSRATISSLHAKQSHALSSSNIISASNANALCVENTSQYASNSMRVHYSTFVPVWYVPPKVLLVDDDL